MLIIINRTLVLIILYNSKRILIKPKEKQMKGIKKRKINNKK
jgi:hypothetical protein